MAQGMLRFLAGLNENAALTGSLLAQAFPIWPVSAEDFRGKES
jgi:hypothetical protein